MTPRLARLEFPFSVVETVEFYRKYYGPTQKAFDAIADEKQVALRQDMESLYAEQNHASDGTTIVEAEYLEIDGVRT